eukprot:GHVR01120334.1.p1 GENE.GHVR01120334.1~~GHVR01120334.1.p1  ORF type:complete len:437 (+),score=83.33 GHVR01120334.1:38-1312(+)
MDDQRMQKAIQLAQQAVGKDNEKKYEEALDLYKHSLEYWSVVLRYQTNPALKDRLAKKMDEYMTRAEQIKKYLSTNTAAVPLAEDGTVQTGGGDDKDAEYDKMTQALQSAIITEKPDISWNDVAGLEHAKQSLQEAVILPVKFPQMFTEERKPWKGILLYGPPGTGKSHLAKACATEADATFLSVSSSDLVSKWQGESEKLVRTLFQMARDKKPSIVFIDEVDSLCSARSDNESESSRRIKTEFLVQMEGVGKDSEGVLILGATNVPWGLDAAIRRRFERRIYIPLPDVHARKRLLELSIGKTKCNIANAELQKLGEDTEGFSGADISVLVRDALFQPVRKCRTATHFKKVLVDGKGMLTPCSPADKDPTKTQCTLMEVEPSLLLVPMVQANDFYTSLSNAKASVSADDILKQVQWTKEFGMEG